MTTEHTLAAHTRASFRTRALEACAKADRPERVAALMLNAGLLCDSACPHCHHSCTPLSTETMSRETMLQALELADVLRPEALDITGGEPELWAHLRECVALARGAGHPVRVRTNLVTLERPESKGLARFLAEQGASLLGSLPGTRRETLARQRTADAWDATIRVLHHLTDLGFASPGGPRLDLAYNPPLGELPRPQRDVESEFRDALGVLGIQFDSLLVIGNVPVGRFGAGLAARGAYDDYLAELEAAFNPAVVEALDCRHGVEIAWDGTVWDCDFNLGARVPPAAGPATLAEVLAAPDPAEALLARRIGFARHCYACTAGAGTG